ncbi:hypothetical protein CAPTEDRAFT_189046 [Capitella teleta]|uniref:Uncharacterized protein n=1 Tax=Capitella teleta TaxID=283909 RepID=R7UUS4_CAPTE|nr:hypothetical protein CAPTEDRAFT_189046 [Capitella teleta]|eukprot:ELU07677.1 hypothetical protein CAPTEDRAFT_189046 [Capitella teleta]
MRLLLVLTLLGCLYLVHARRRFCDIAADCGDVHGRTVCWSHLCHRNIPCNKDDDCFFYGSANVPKFRCYIVPEVEWPAGYGTCVEETTGGVKYDPLPDEMENSINHT